MSSFKKSKRIILFAGLLLGGCSETSTEPKWQTYKSEEFGISVDSPYPLNIHTDTLKEKNESGKYVEADRKAPEVSILDLFKEPKPIDFYVGFYSAIANNKNPEYNCHDLIDEYNSPIIKLNKNFESIKSPMTFSGMPATLVSNSYISFTNKKDDPSKTYLSIVYVVKGRQYWRIYAGYTDKEKCDSMAERVIKSIKILSKSP